MVGIEEDPVRSCHPADDSSSCTSISTSGTHRMTVCVDTVTAEVGPLLDDQKKLSAKVTSAVSELKDLRPPLKKLEGQVQLLTTKVVPASWSTELRMQRADTSGTTSK
ncbi:hypothetical protein NDU88_004370 [Pleurodeles waltl]|uniref:Uncharacterized protein n=1 Tax=Pleurodeles waltl TaxID=8319 RepID=A0AAV7QEN7_PLEWA|nr:hypothetical protein NDU88_004370 [Pleurodeles waltl]